MGKTPKAVTSKTPCMLTCVFMLVQTKCGLVLVSDNSFYSIVLVLSSNIAIYT